MKIGAVILARLDSQRLAGKALRLIGGRPLLGYGIDLCRRVAGVDAVTLATTVRAVDDPLEAFARGEGIGCVRGDTEDVAGRFLQAMDAEALDAALRLNGDSPLNRPELLSQAVRVFRDGQLDLVSNVPGRTYPYGLSVEVVGREAMRSAYSRMSVRQREHVTLYFYEQAPVLRMHLITSGSDRYQGRQLAVDTERDLNRFAWIREELGRRFWQATVEELCAMADTFDANEAAFGAGGGTSS